MDIVFATCLGPKSKFRVEEPDENGWRKISYGTVEIGAIHADGVQLASYIDGYAPWEHNAQRPLLVAQVGAYLRQLYAPPKPEVAPSPVALNPLERIAQLEARLAKLEK